ncbi:hypothetical protein M0N77_07950 [Psychrobacter sp. AH5]|uniref:hypothetical protein n=1 Tax=Psychrobacter sp. AH5 TaxID=2937433 RepID=UPI003341A1B4
MVISLARMLQSFGQVQDDLPTRAAKNVQQAASLASSETTASEVQTAAYNDAANAEQSKPTALTAPKRAERIYNALAEVSDIGTPTPLTDRYLANRAAWRSPNRPPFDPDTLWYLKHGRCPIMTELVDVVDEATLNAMPIEAVAILDRINGKLKRYRDWSDELNEEQQQQHNERQFVIDKLVNESIPEALRHYEQLLRFSPHRTKNSMVQGKMTAGDMLTDLFLEIDYELDELLDELHQTVLNRLASTHRYVKSRTQS